MADSGASNVENCLSAGKITSSKASVIGSIAGRALGATNITHCYWTSDVGYNISRDRTAIITDSYIISLNTTTMDELNVYSKRNSTWSSWLMLNLNGGSINNLEQETLVVTQKRFPVPKKENGLFVGWFTDANLNEAYDGKSEVTNLYAKYDKAHTMTFDFGNGTTTKGVFRSGEEIRYPSTSRDGYTFVGLFADKACTTPFTSTSVTESMTLYAKYKGGPSSSSSSSGESKDKGDASFAFQTGPLFMLLSLII